jgi:hypothetical protein
MLDIGYQGHWGTHSRLRNNITAPLDAKRPNYPN